MIKDVLGFKLSQGFRGVGVETPFSLRWDVDFFSVSQDRNQKV